MNDGEGPSSPPPLPFSFRQPVRSGVPPLTSLALDTLVNHSEGIIDLRGMDELHCATL